MSCRWQYSTPAILISAFFALFPSHSMRDESECLGSATLSMEQREAGLGPMKELSPEQVNSPGIRWLEELVVDTLRLSANHQSPLDRGNWTACRVCLRLQRNVGGGKRGRSPRRPSRRPSQENKYSSAWQCQWQMPISSSVNRSIITSAPAGGAGSPQQQLNRRSRGEST